MKQGEIWYASLDPTKGSEQAGFRPVVIFSGNLINEFAPVIICCPLTTKTKHYKGNPILKPNKSNGLKKQSEIMLIQIRSLAKDRLRKRIGSIKPETIVEMRETMMDLLRY